VSTWVWIAVAGVGGSGAIARYVVDGIVATRIGREFPFGTLAVNLSGALLLGFVTGLAPSEDLGLIVGTATIGSYTTFSTWMLETQRLGEDGEARLSAANIVVSAALGLAVAALGRAIAMGL
jgi:CrcB protein